MYAKQGYVRSFRDKWFDPSFDNFKEVALWSWMVDMASWCDDYVVNTAPKKGGKILLKRGQIFFYPKIIYPKFSMRRSSLDNFLQRLETSKKIHLAHNGDAYIVTILDYDLYQYNINKDNNYKYKSSNREADHDTAKTESGKSVQPSAYTSRPSWS